MKYLILIAFMASVACTSNNNPKDPVAEVERKTRDSSAKVVSEEDLSSVGCVFQTDERQRIILLCETVDSYKNRYNQVYQALLYKSKNSSELENNKLNKHTKVALLQKGLAVFDFTAFSDHLDSVNITNENKVQRVTWHFLTKSLVLNEIFIDFSMTPAVLDTESFEYKEKFQESFSVFKSRIQRLKESKTGASKDDFSFADAVIEIFETI